MRRRIHGYAEGLRASGAPRTQMPRRSGGVSFSVSSLSLDLPVDNPEGCGGGILVACGRGWRAELRLLRNDPFQLHALLL